MKQSISQLAALTGKTRETVSKRLSAAGLKPTSGKGTAQEFESTVALPAIFEAPEGGQQGELMRARCRNLDLDSQLKAQKHAVAAGELIAANVVERVWSGMTGAARSCLLSMPYRMAVACQGADFGVIEVKARELIYEALTNLSKFDPRDYLLDSPPAEPDPPPAEI